MKASRKVAIVAAGILLACAGEKAFAQGASNATSTPAVTSGENARDVIQGTGDIRADKKEIIADTKDIREEAKEIAGDTTQIKTDRGALRNAINSGDQSQIKAARETLHKDLKERRGDLKDLKKDKRDRRKDIKDLNRDRRQRRHNLSGRR